MSLTLTTTTTNLVLNNGASLCSKPIRHRRRKLLSPLPPPSLMTLSSKPFSSYGCAAMPFIFTDRNNFSRVRSMQPQDTGNASDASLSDSNADRHNIVADNMIEDSKTDTDNPRSSFLAKLALALGVAATITFISVGFRWPIQGSSARVPFLVDGSLTSTPVAPSTSFTFKAFGYQFVLPQYAPGWVYFWLLMAAGCGLFVSEEALNIWVGTSLARLLTVDGTWKSFGESFSRNTPYIISTVLWVYWGVCISDMIPFYVGRFFRQSGASEDVCSKLGIGKEKAASVTRAVQRYGNLIGFVERFSVGARNPTSFLAGALGISAECFFAGVCCGGLVTLPVQLGIGFLLRERPVVALASVATVVIIWINRSRETNNSEDKFMSGCEYGVTRSHMCSSTTMAFSILSLISGLPS